MSLDFSVEVVVQRTVWQKMKSNGYASGYLTEQTFTSVLKQSTYIVFVVLCFRVVPAWDSWSQHSMMLRTWRGAYDAYTHPAAMLITPCGVIYCRLRDGTLWRYDE